MDWSAIFLESLCLPRRSLEVAADSLFESARLLKLRESRLVKTPPRHRLPANKSMTEWETGYKIDTADTASYKQDSKMYHLCNPIGNNQPGRNPTTAMTGKKASKKPGLFYERALDSEIRIAFQKTLEYIACLP